MWSSTIITIFDGFFLFSSNETPWTLTGCYSRINIRKKFATFDLFAPFDRHTKVVFNFQIGSPWPSILNHFICYFFYVMTKNNFHMPTFRSTFSGNLVLKKLLAICSPNFVQVGKDHTKEIHYILPPRIWKVSHSTKIPLELLGQATGCSAGPSSSKGNFRGMRHFSNIGR